MKLIHKKVKETMIQPDQYDIPVPFWLLATINIIIFVTDQRAGFTISDLCTIGMLLIAIAKHHKQIGQFSEKVIKSVKNVFARWKR